MRAAITAGLTQAIVTDNLINDYLNDGSITQADFIAQIADRILAALADAGVNTANNVVVLPANTPVIPVSLAGIIASAATEALNRDTEAECITSGQHGLRIDDDGYCNACGYQWPSDDDQEQPLSDDEVLTALLDGGYDPHQSDFVLDGDTVDPYADHILYQVPAGPDLRQVRNMVRPLALLFGAAVYYRFDRDTGARVMDVASPAAVKDVFTDTITGLTQAARQYIDQQRMHPNSAARLYATIGAMLSTDLMNNPTFQSMTGALPTSRAMLRANTDAPARRLRYALTDTEGTEIADAARILLIENTPEV